MRQIKNKFLIILALLCLVASGCASQGGNDYSNQQERKAMTVKRGTISEVRVVRTSNSSTGVGAAAGGIVGGVLGRYIGGGSGRVVGSVGGALGGAAAGAGVEKGMRDHDALELTIKLDSGQEIVIVQDPDDTFAVGDRVRVLSSSDGTSRVQRD